MYTSDNWHIQETGSITSVACFLSNWPLKQALFASAALTNRKYLATI